MPEEMLKLSKAWKQEDGMPFQSLILIEYSKIIYISRKIYLPYVFSTIE